MRTTFVVLLSIVAIFLLVFAGLFLRVYVVVLFIVMPLVILALFEKHLFLWLKGSLVGTSIFWPFGYILLVWLGDGFCLYTSQGVAWPNQCRELIFKTTDFIPIPTFFGWLFTLAIGFIIGAIIGLIVGKIKSRRT